MSIFFIIVGVRLIETQVIKEAEERVRNDLNSAREIYKTKLKDVSDIIRVTSNRFFLKEAILSGNSEKIANGLIPVRDKEGLDILNVTDKIGNVIYRTSNPSIFGDSQKNDAIIKGVLSRNGHLGYPTKGYGMGDALALDRRT